MKRCLILALIAFSCGDHFSTQEAYVACEAHAERSPSNHPPESFADCVACYESCGSECEPLGSAPEDYGCPDD